MADRRRYTGAQRLQLGWTVIVVVLGVLAPLAVPSWLYGGVPYPGVLAGVSLLWILGLIGVGLYERNQWNSMVAESSFRSEQGTRQVDLEKIVGGRSVVVETDVSGFFAQAHTEIRTAIEEVEASFTIELTYVGVDGHSEGLTTGNESLDERFVIEGTEQNVGKLLSPDVQAALTEVETPGWCTVTGERVVYEVPFTRLSAQELDTLGDTIVVIAERIERVAATG
jgi:hypothetical protein